MMQATQTAATGMRAQQTRLDTIANNISNINTVGYRSSRTDFKTALYARMKDPVGDSAKQNLLKGTGVVVGSTDRDFSDGSVQGTDAELDFAITGKGFFTEENENGEQLYSRNGHFSLSSEDGNNYLVNANGYYVLSDSGQRISIPTGSTVSVDEDGTLACDGVPVARLGLADFTNQEGLEDVGNSCFQETANSGTPYQAETARITQASLEKSNVELGEEMTLMMRAQRTYSLASKALQTADEMDGLANNMR